MGFIGGEWDISVLGLDVVSVRNSWLEGVADVMVVSVLDFESLGVSEFLFWSVLGLNVIASGLDGDLSGSNFSFGFGLDAILDFIVVDLNVSESFISSLRSMGMN